MGKSSAGAFLSGLGAGYVTGTGIDLARMRSEREAEAHETSQAGAKIKLGRLNKEEPLFDKELQLRGLAADYDLNEQTFRTAQQGVEQSARKNLTAAGRIRAGMAVPEAEAAAARQPTEIGIGNEQLNAQLSDVVMRQTANVWNMLKLGNHSLALSMLNESQFLSGGQKYKEFKMEKDDKGSHLILVPEGEGKKEIRVPVQHLEELSKRYLSRYEKAGNNIVRINADGTATPVYEQDQFMSVPAEGSVVNRRTGQPPAAGGINPPQRPPGSDRFTGRIDERVTKGRLIVDKYFGINEFMGLDPGSQPAYIGIIDSMGRKIRTGEDPEAAATQAIAEHKRAEALRRSGKPGGGAAYTGPAPWRQ